MAAFNRVTHNTYTWFGGKVGIVVTHQHTPGVQIGHHKACPICIFGTLVALVSRSTRC